MPERLTRALAETLGEADAGTLAETRAPKPRQTISGPKKSAIDEFKPAGADQGATESLDFRQPQVIMLEAAPQVIQQLVSVLRFVAKQDTKLTDMTQMTSYISY